LSVIAGLLYVCTSPSLWLAAGLFAIYVVSRLAHFLVLLTHRSHEVRALFWTIGSVVVYFMAGAVIWHALAR
jgi:glutathione S-transferase